MLLLATEISLSVIPRMNTRRTQRSNSPLRPPLITDRRRHRTVQGMASPSFTADGAHTPASGSVSVFAPVAAPVLRSVDPVKVARFLKERERYELEISAKQAEVPSLKVLPYTASIDRSLLKNLFFMGKFDSIAADASSAKDLTDAHIEMYIKSLVSRPSNADFDPSIIEKALEGFSMPTYIANADARITHYCADFFERLESVGCGDFREENPKKAISLLLGHLQPAVLKREMRRRLSYDEVLEKNLKKFIKVLSREAINCQIYGVESKESTRKPSNSKPGNGKGFSKEIETGKRKAKPDTISKEAPLCLWEHHNKKGIRHYLRNCKECPKEIKDRLFEEHRSKKNDGAKRATDTMDEEARSVVFTATFGDRHRANICADTCSDDNILDKHMLLQFKKAGVEYALEDLARPRTFDMAADLPNGKRASITCDQVVTVDTELHIRHGSALVLRGVRWLVTDQAVGDPLLGRPLLEALGLNTRDILAAAAERHSGVVDVSTFFGTGSDHSPSGKVARILEGVFHADGGADDADLDEDDGWLDMGPEDPSEKEQVRKKRVQEASEKGMSDKGREELEKLLIEYGDVIKLRLDGKEPAKIDPLRVNLKQDAVPIRAKQRRYPPPKKEFMTRYVRQLLKLGLVKKATAPEWVSAPLIVPKRPPAMFRLTVDYRPVNNATVQTFWPMPNIEAELADARGAKAFAAIDFCSGYWQAPLHPDSQPLFAFMTPEGVVMPTRTTQGGTNSAANFQEKVAECFAELRENFKAWIDDFIIFAKDEKHLLHILRRFFEICRSRNLIVSLLKSDFFLTEATWCGRIIDANGVRFNPSNLSGLKNCEFPRNAGELCEYVHGVSWISTSIPRFAQRAAPLRELLETAYEKAGGSRKKKSIAKFNLKDLGWSEEHENAFNDLQDQLQEATRLAHRNPDMTLCVHTDASDKHWAVCATQCDASELSKPIMDQEHQPLAFLSGTFSEREEHWSTYEREAFAVIQAFRKLDYLLACDPTTRVFTDHRNLLFTFNPVAMEPSLGRHKVLKVIRWALFLSAFNYRIEHVPGDSNTWPDIMTRWMRGYRKAPSVRRITATLPFNGVTVPPDSPEFEWPDISQIISTQNEYKAKAPKNAILNDGGILVIKNAVWIPEDCIDLKLRLLTIAHAGNAGHRGSDPTWHALRERFTWVGLRDDVRSFVSSCLLCVLSKSGNKVPRPLSTTLHATKPNEIIHFDYLFLGEGEDDKKYVLVVKDDLSGYCWLEPTTSADSEHTAEVLARWNRVFTTPKVWVSDQGSHFKNEVLDHLAKTYRIRHNFTVAYSPWANGTVESLMRSILSATRAMIAELKLAPQDWASVIPTIASVLNEASLDRLGRRPDGIARSPLEAMTGIAPNRPVLRILPNSPKLTEEKTLEYARATQVIAISELQSALDQVHKDVERSVSLRRERAIASHNKATNIVTPSFAIGDFVLVRRANDRGHKLRFRWYGPSRITAVHSPLVYGITSLQGGKVDRVHCARLIKYRDSLLGEPVPKEMIDLAERIESRYDIVDKITDVGEAPDGLFLRVQWQGLPDKRDWTWQPASELYADIPDTVTDFLKTFKSKKNLVSKIKRQLSIV